MITVTKLSDFTELSNSGFVALPSYLLFSFSSFLYRDNVERHAELLRINYYAVIDQVVCLKTVHRLYYCYLLPKKVTFSIIGY